MFSFSNPMKTESIIQPYPVVDTQQQAHVLLLKTYIFKRGSQMYRLTKKILNHLGTVVF